LENLVFLDDVFRGCEVSSERHAMLSPWPRHANTSHSGVYAFSFFLPIILRQGLGYSLELSFVLTAFPPCFAVIVVMTVSWLADKYRVTGFLDTPVPRYVGTFLGYAGAVGLVVTSMSWMANNLRGDGKRAVATAIMISISGVGGIYSSLVFRQQVRHTLSSRKLEH
jgi:archaellum biogenesis protein FlaJ (TadC family)